MMKNRGTAEENIIKDIRAIKALKRLREVL